MSEARLEGILAWRMGLTLAYNPYFYDEPEHKDWIAGFNDPVIRDKVVN